jgi:anion-transporting  ArsA/GET3 family ATPase
MLGPLIAGRRVVLCTGGGGVGKTTIAAALALAATRAGRRAEVLDPAALDPRPAWERRLRAEGGERLLGNRFYQRLVDGFTAYLAADELCRRAEAGAHDLTVVDAPAALELFETPARIRALLDPDVLRWLLAPYRPGAGIAGARGPIARLVVATLERAAGTGALVELADFFAGAATLRPRFAACADALDRLLRDAGTAIVLVAAPDARGVADARAARDRLGRLGLAPAALVVNRVYAPPPSAAPEDVRAALAAAGVTGPVGDWLADNLRAHQRRAAAEAASVAALGASVAVPDLEADVIEAVARHVACNQTGA